MLGLLLLDLLARVVGRLLPLQLHPVSAAEVLKHLLAASAGETFQVQCGMSLLVNGDRDGLILHGGSPPHGKLQPHLLTFLGLDRFTLLQDVTLGARHGQGLLLFVELLNTP